MGSRQKGLLAIGLGFAAVVTFAWFSKPPTLRQKFERRGVHFKRDVTSYPMYGKGEQREAYDIGNDELPRLEEGLKAEGFNESKPTPLYDGTVDYEFFQPTRPQGAFGAYARHLFVRKGSKTTVFFDFQL